MKRETCPKCGCDLRTVLTAEGPARICSNAYCNWDDIPEVESTHKILEKLGETVAPRLF